MKKIRNMPVKQKRYLATIALLVTFYRFWKIPWKQTTHDQR